MSAQLSSMAEKAQSLTPAPGLYCSYTPDPDRAIFSSLTTTPQGQANLLWRLFMPHHLCCGPTSTPILQALPPTSSYLPGAAHAALSSSECLHAPFPVEVQAAKSKPPKPKPGTVKACLHLHVFLIVFPSPHIVKQFNFQLRFALHSQDHGFRSQNPTFVRGKVMAITFIS